MSPNQSAPPADDAARQEAEYQSLLAKRVRLLQTEQRLRDDIARIQAPQRAAEQAYARSAPVRLRELQEQRQLVREQVAVQRQVREMDLRQRYGTRLGGALAGAERFGRSGAGRALMGGTAAAGVSVGGLARSGFGGTVEQGRFDFEMKLLSREVAAAFKPLLEVATAVVSRVRRFMEKLGPGGQNAVMAGGLALGAYGTYRAVRTVGSLFGMGGAAAAGGGGAGSVLGSMAAMMGIGGGGGGGGAMGPAAMAALAGTSAIPMAGAGAAGGGIRAALGRAIRFPVKHPFVTAAVVAGTMAGIGGGNGGDEWFRKYHGDNAIDLDDLQGGGGADALQKRRNALMAGRGTFSKATSWLGARAGYAGQERDTIEEIERRLSAMGVNAETGKQRRQVTPDQFGYEEVGSAYKRASVGFLSKNAPGDKAEGEGGAAAGLADALKTVAAILQQIERNTDRKADVR